MCPLAVRLPRGRSYNGRVITYLKRVPLVIGGVLLLVALVMMFLNYMDLTRLATAASTLNRTYEDPTRQVFLTCLVFLGSGFLLGLGLAGSRGKTPG
jgi:hypothetical protein